MPSGMESPAVSATEPRRKQWLIVPLLLLASIFLLCLAYLQYNWPGSLTSSAAHLNWSGSSFNLTQGQGEKGSRALTIDAMTDQNVAVAAVVTKIFRATDYSRVSWDIANNQPGLNMAFLWRTAEHPARFFSRPLLPTKTGLAPLDMTGDENWRGQVIGLALLVKGELNGPITVNGVSIQPVSAWQELEKIVRQWFAATALDASSINFVDAAAFQQDLPLLFAIAAVVLLALCLYLILAKFTKLRVHAAILWCIVFAGWFALDARWQWTLFQQLVSTSQRYAGKSWDRKHLEAEDGVLFDFMRQVSAKLPAHGRVLYFSDDAYSRGKGAYYLYPRNVMASGDFSLTGKLKPGEHVVVFAKEGARYDLSRQVLVLDGGATLAADLLFSAAGNLMLKVR